MWWIYLLGSLLMFIMMFIRISQSSGDAMIGLIAGLWLLNSARVAYREDQRHNTTPRP
ncbi:hypothetical protein KJ836_02530 [Patescibacteria group bacterium]|nr:hypothetical protein [Patescibacteria group bacterium]